jgi:hypothetical protein
MSDIKHRITKLEQTGSRAEDIMIFDPLPDGTFRQGTSGRIFTGEELRQIKGHILIWNLPAPETEMDANEREAGRYETS